MNTIFLGNSDLPWIAPLRNMLQKEGNAIAIKVIVKFDLQTIINFFNFFSKSSCDQNFIYKVPQGFNNKLNFIYKKKLSNYIDLVVRESMKTCNQAPCIFVSDISFAKYLYKCERYKIVFLIYDYDIRQNTITEIYSQFFRLCDVILCSSYQLSLKIKKVNPIIENKIVYFPHGSNLNFINPKPNILNLETNIVVNGYLSARYDWELIYAVISRLPKIKFLFVGNIVLSDFNKRRDKWHNLLLETLKLPNVNHIEGLPHLRTIEYYWKCTIAWLPYDINVIFNFYSCPLKIMDAISSGMPVISTPIPECTLYKEFITICDSFETTIEKFQLIIDNKLNPKANFNNERQLNFAKNSSWENRVLVYNKILNSIK